MQATQPGQLVQIDHMTIHADGRTFKQFHAKDSITKALYVRTYSGAIARTTAACTLRTLAPRCPDLNGPVEHSNRTLRTGFRSTYTGELTVRTVNKALKDHPDDQHEVRPHQALG